MRYKYVYNKLFLLCIFPFFLLVNGCAQQAVLPCPKALILSEASSVTTFLTPEGTDITDIETETIIDRIARSCVYKDSNVSVTTAIKFDIKNFLCTCCGCIGCFVTLLKEFFFSFYSLFP